LTSVQPVGLDVLAAIQLAAASSLLLLTCHHAVHHLPDLKPSQQLLARILQWSLKPWLLQPAVPLQVWVSSAEVSAMAQYLRISAADFQARYCQPYSGVPGWRLLQSKLVDAPQQQQQQISTTPMQGQQQQLAQQQQQQVTG
jgi:hypothetical protein